jgi:hypothetical protein
MQASEVVIRGRRLAGLALVVAVLGASCAACASHALPSTSPASTDALESGLVTRADLGGDWISEDGMVARQLAIGDVTFSLCPQAKSQAARALAVRSDGMATGPVINSTKGVYFSESFESAADAPRLFKLFAGSLKACAGDEWTEAAVVDHTIAALALPRVGDESISARLSFGSSDTEEDAWLTVVRRGHTVGFIRVGDVGRPGTAGYTTSDYVSDLRAAVAKMPR